MCLSLCMELEPSLYLRTDTNEIRTGLIAQSCNDALLNRSLPTSGVIGSEMHSVDPSPALGVPGSEPEEMMTLAYDRLVPFLLGAVQKLTERVAQLEAGALT